MRVNGGRRERQLCSQSAIRFPNKIEVGKKKEVRIAIDDCSKGYMRPCDVNWLNRLALVLV